MVCLGVNNSDTSSRIRDLFGVVFSHFEERYPDFPIAQFPAMAMQDANSSRRAKPPARPTRLHHSPVSTKLNESSIS